MNRASIDTTSERTLQFVGGRTVKLPILSLLITRLVPVNRATGILFNAENPFTTHNILTGIGR
jgi:hypothetical protein